MDIITHSVANRTANSIKDAESCGGIKMDGIEIDSDLNDEVEDDLDPEE